MQPPPFHPRHARSRLLPCAAVVASFPAMRKAASFPAHVAPLRLLPRHRGLLRRGGRGPTGASSASYGSRSCSARASSASRSACAPRRSAPCCATCTRPRAPARRVLKEHLLMVTLNVISRMLLGKKYVGEDGAGPGAAATPEEFRWMIEEIFLNGALHVGDMVSWLGWLDAHGYVGRMKRLAAKFDRFIEHVLREHGERQQREGGAFVPGDMVDLLLYLYLAGGTLQYGARNLVSIDNPVTPPPPAPVSGPPIGPGFVRPPPPPQEV
uniref:Uncharacterized protein n=1 Tax=Zea mays TaxID=4577 RepID=A0A804QKL9_MAIZE